MHEKKLKHTTKMTSLHILFLIILSSSSITLTSAAPAVVDPNKKVTNEYITNICSKSSDRTLCFDLLKDLIGYPVVKATFATLAIRPMSKAEALARDTYKMIEGMDATLVDPKREVRERYRKCMLEYSTATKYLGEARGFMQQRNGVKKVKSYAASAAGRANACDKNFAKPPKIPLNLKNANQKFKDLCSVIVAICNKM